MYCSSRYIYERNGGKNPIGKKKLMSTKFQCLSCFITEKRI